MLPFYFGPSDSPLFGVYHPPEGGGVATRGVVLCQPTRREYIHAHAAMRSLAERLAGEGLHVLRFDYHGSGDSSGRGEETSVERWTEDVSVAVEELRDAGGVHDVTLVGLRLGATLALLEARKRSDVRRLVLWDPVVDGEEYVENLLAEHRRMVRERHPPVDDGASEAGGRAPDEGGAGTAPGGATDEALGFPLPERLRAELEEIELRDLRDPGTAHVGILSSDEKDACARLHSRFSEAGHSSELRHVPVPGSWVRLHRIGRAQLPADALTEIVDLVRRTS